MTIEAHWYQIKTFFCRAMLSTYHSGPDDAMNCQQQIKKTIKTSRWACVLAYQVINLNTRTFFYSYKRAGWRKSARNSPTSWVKQPRPLTWVRVLLHYDRNFQIFSKNYKAFLTTGQANRIAFANILSDVSTNFRVFCLP